MNWRTSNGSTSLMPLIVSANFFDVMGVPMFMGRGFTASEAAAEQDPRLAVMGRASRTSGIATRLRHYAGSLAADLARPGAESRRAARVSSSVDRLHDGQSAQSAFPALDTVAARVAATDFPGGTGALEYVSPVGGLSQLDEIKEIAVFFGGLIVVTWLVLAIACANVAGLLLARGVARRKEIAMRLAIGATRARVMQQLLTEGFVLSIIGTAAGFAITVVIARLVEQIRLPLPLPVVFDVTFDQRLGVLAGAMVMVSTILCAMVPALQATRASVLPGLKLDVQSYGHRRLR